ncbi:hypothetical protein [Caballeronia sp. dw_19]|uniref:hypothetical protein n=1 Tax=Caballeronia sp. dw_19 TaxID=2719791 RepID=UPI002102E57B|nr:hypothetical protein [Caballeronia sp. dw_19]
MTDHRKMTPRFAKRVAQMRAICEKLGLKPLSEERAQEIFESHAAQRDDAILTARARFGERDSYVIVAQLSPQFTARLVDRWHRVAQWAMARAVRRWCAHSSSTC